MKLLRHLALLPFVVMLTVGSPIMADTTIEIVVNNEPITSYDIDQRVKLMRLANEKGGRKKAIEELIDEALKMQDAKFRGLKVADERVETAYASLARGVKMSSSQLSQALRTEGINPDTLKKRLRAQIAWSGLVRARQSAVSRVSEADITSALLAEGPTEKMTLKEFTLQQIIFVVPSGSSSGYVSQRRREAESFRQRFKGCENSVEQAKSLRGVVVRNAGRRDSSQLAGRSGEEIQKTKVGKTTRPEQTDEGIELVAVCSVREIESSAGVRAEIENKLKLEQSENLGEEYLVELRKRAVIKYR